MISKIFSYVDEDKSGFLEFDEYLVFTFIMEAGFQVCDGCLAPVIIAGYTCRTCWEECNSELGPATDSFDLCACCFGSDAFSHPTDHDLVPTALMYHHLLTSSTSSAPLQDSTREVNEVQCTICEDYHVKDLGSALVAGKEHMATLPDSSPPTFVCEWCATYMCVYCGTFCNDPSYTDLKPMQWLRKDLCCGDCKTNDLYKLDYDKALKILEKNELFKKCSTCAQKLKDETLMQVSEDSDVGSSRFMDPITQTMAMNLQLQQAYFNAKMMSNFGRAMVGLC
ncbi:hypothetical protein GOP47_0011427 [Adiantum capillus-veneris]|uniref:EF-hand domain-containing protein n=1 Tax=Adiantum capillus-veneris TaxID=13818 RepID=A0A9D4USR9_ADICA|nr:hypothetical protein GOP47_0011427 [Adiantum capillus-veneris]